MSRKLPVPVDQSPRVTTLQDLAGLVRNARARGQLRIDDAAAVSGVSSDLLSRLERGRPVTSDKLLDVLASLGLAMLVIDQRQADMIQNLLNSHAAQDL